MSVIKDDIRKFIAEKLIYGPYTYSDETRFVKEGIFDSMSVLEISIFIGEHFGFRTDEGDITPENYGTINNMEKFVLRKLQEKKEQEPPKC